MNVLPSGDIVVAGQYDPDDGSGGERDAGFFLVRMTRAGELVWSWRYAPPEGWNVMGNVKLVVLPDGGFAVVGTWSSEETFPQIFLAYANDSGNLEGQVREIGFFPVTARGLVFSPNGTLLIVGSIQSSIEEDSDRAILYRTSVTNPELLQEYDYRNSDFTSFNRIINRLNGGYLITGNSFCGNNAVLISIKESLRDTVAYCSRNERDDAWRFFTVEGTNGGEFSQRNSQQFTPEPLRSLTPGSFNKFCPKLQVIPAYLPDPICYQTPLRLLDTVLQISPLNSVQRVSIRLGANAGAEEGLVIGNVPNNVTVSGDGTSRLTLEITGNETEITLAPLLSQLSYVNNGIITETISRNIILLAGNQCSFGGQVGPVSFTVAPQNFPFSHLPADTLLCAGQTLDLCGPVQPGLRYAWSTGDTTACTAVSAPGSHTLVRSSPCATDTSTIVVSATDETALLPEQDVELLCLGDSLTVSPLLPPGVSATWTDGFPNLERTLLTSGTYTLQRSNTCGTAPLVLELNTTDCCQLYLPNAFSPNGDGVNDRFRAFINTDHCRLLTDYQLTIYNRWGGLVYEGTAPTDGWDGRVAGRLANPGYFVYTLRYFNGQETVERSGGFTLVR